MNKLPLLPLHPLPAPKNFKKLQNFFLMIFWENLFKGVGVSYPLF